MIAKYKDDDLISIPEIAKIFNVTKERVFKMYMTGELPKPDKIKTYNKKQNRLWKYSVIIGIYNQSNSVQKSKLDFLTYRYKTAKQKKQFAKIKNLSIQNNWQSTTEYVKYIEWNEKDN